ncbi:MAG: hypothetical protein JRF60_14655 [Deltaproteobacteria bacterium]|nr:hypothetical protein [Deltaproteobacteria bacterium]
MVESLAKVIRSLFRDIEDFDLIEKGKLGILKKEIAEIERMLKKLIKSLENKPLNPGPLESLSPLLQINWRRILFLNPINL